MKEFHPPIHTRDTEELVAMTHGNTHRWQQEAIDQARTELYKRGVGEQEQQEILEKLRAEEARKEAALREQRAGNRLISYKPREMFVLIVSMPLVFLLRRRSGDSLADLWRENYRMKFWQRLVLMVIGIGLWISVAFIASRYFGAEGNK
jgi:hypothetical protein